MMDLPDPDSLLSTAVQDPGIKARQTSEGERVSRETPAVPGLQLDKVKCSCVV